MWARARAKANRRRLGDLPTISQNALGSAITCGPSSEAQAFLVSARPTQQDDTVGRTYVAEVALPESDPPLKANLGNLQEAISDEYDVSWLPRDVSWLPIFNDLQRTLADRDISWLSIFDDLQQTNADRGGCATVLNDPCSTGRGNYDPVRASEEFQKVLGSHII